MTDHDVVYHFTDTARFPWILKSRKLIPSHDRRDAIENGLPSSDFLWATTDEHGDRTASAMHKWDENTWCGDSVRLVRITLLAENFEPWSSSITRCPQWTPEHVKLMEDCARKWSVDPRTWRCRTEPLAQEWWIAVETRSFLGSWQPFEYRNNLDLVAGNNAVLVIGDQAFLTPHVILGSWSDHYDCQRVPLTSLAFAGPEFKRKHDECEAEWENDRARAERRREQDAYDQDDDEALYQQLYEAMCDDVWSDR
jgi:hypothetical protein